MKARGTITIAGGLWRGRKLTYPDAGTLRPTMERTRVSLFSSLGATVEGSVFADLYAGAGAVGLEALSRGARHVHFVERDREALAALMDNLKAFAIDGSAYSIHAGSVAAVLDARPCALGDSRLAFADPPYDADIHDEFLTRWCIEEFNDLVTLVAEHRTRLTLTPPHGMRIERERRFGDTTLTYFVPSGDVN